GVLHWVSESSSGVDPVKVEVRLFDKLFKSENPAELDDWLGDLNPDSKFVVRDAYAVPSLKNAAVGDRFQFERLGYFVVDGDSCGGKLVFNRTVTLRDSYGGKSGLVPDSRFSIFVLHDKTPQPPSRNARFTMDLARFRSISAPGGGSFPPPPRKPASPAIVMSLEKRKIEGVSEELNAIASQNLDHAPARRRVRLAFSKVQEQLHHVLFKMAPSGIRTEEWYEINYRGQEIFCKCWLPNPGVRIKGSLFFCHGYGDTCTFFFEGIAKHIAASGYGVYAMDHPGFGLSEGLHGYVPSFNVLVDNAIELFRIMKERPEIQGLPRFIFGQSMGGAVAIEALLRTQDEWDGIVLVAPMCKISGEMKPPLSLQKVLILLSNFIPKAKLVPSKDLAELAFREETKRRVASYNVICYSDQTRLKTAVELLNATTHIESQLDKISCPMLILHGGADKVTDPDVSRFLYESAAAGDKTLKLYENGFHCILEGESDDRIRTVLGDIVSWLDSRT
ncbi:hypothetical protein M569_10681, partial [Genlisea aurea]